MRKLLVATYEFADGDLRGAIETGLEVVVLEGQSHAGDLPAPQRGVRHRRRRQLRAGPSTWPATTAARTSSRSPSIVAHATR